MVLSVSGDIDAYKTNERGSFECIDVLDERSFGLLLWAGSAGLWLSRACVAARDYLVGHRLSVAADLEPRTQAEDGVSATTKSAKET